MLNIRITAGRIRGSTVFQMDLLQLQVEIYRKNRYYPVSIIIITGVARKYALKLHHAGFHPGNRGSTPLGDVDKPAAL